jgi:hypothetical protein
MRLRSLAAVLVGLVLHNSSARADMQYQFEFATQSGSTVTFGTAFTVSQGQTISLQVYLAGATPTGNANLSSSGTGLTDGGVSLQYASNGNGNGAVSLGAASTTPGTITPGPAFGGPNNRTVTTGQNGPFGANNTSTGTVEVHSATPVFATVSDGSGNQAILLGTFTFTGSTPGTAATISAFPNQSGSSNVDGSGASLDGLISQSGATISVTAVPEPGSLILTGLAASALGLGAWRRRRRTLVALA